MSGSGAKWSLAWAIAQLAGCLANPAVPIDSYDAGTPAPTCVEPVTVTGPARLLTGFEYDNTVRDLLGDDEHAAKAFPAENDVEGFSNNAKANVVGVLLDEKYAEAALSIGERAAPRVHDWLGCTSGDFDGCQAALTGEFLDRAFRRPATDEERLGIADFFAAQRAEHDFETTIAMSVAVVLESPQFLYRLEPVPPSADAETVPLDAYSLATRLSYFLWSSMPDRTLLRMAKEGQLATAKDIEREARRMLADPRAKAMVRRFHEQWLGTGDFSSVVKDATVFPMWDPALRGSWRDSLAAFVEDAYLGDDGTLRGMLTRKEVFADERLASLYGLDRPTGSAPVSSQENIGLLGQPALLAFLALPNQSSPIRRGVWVRERLLCQPLEPPPNMAIVPPDPDPSLTTRERFAEHTEAAFCKKCHTLIDPIGFGFEGFDAMGRFQRAENGHAIDTHGELDHVEAGAGPFEGVGGLAGRLAGSAEVERCLATMWFRYAMGRLETQDDLCSLANVERTFTDAGGRFTELLVAITQTDAFLLTKGGAR